MEARGSALESMDDSAFNALGLVKKVGLSVKCEANAQRKAKKSNAYFDFVFHTIYQQSSQIAVVSLGNPIQILLKIQ